MLSQIDTSGKEVGEPKDGEPNSFHGILNWKFRNDLVIAKHVFGDNKWVQRYLSTKEKAEFLDFLNTRTAKIDREINEPHDKIRSAWENFGRQPMVPRP